VTFVCDKGFLEQSRGIMAHATVPVVVKTITAGKLRRYAHMSRLRQLLTPSIVGKNIIDSFKIGIGFVQSVALLRREKPDVIFAKGGFVCLPLGAAAHMLRVPLVIHDSDTRAGLTNRVLARWASSIATGFPVEYYPYNPQITQYVGVPIDQNFVLTSKSEQARAKEMLGFHRETPLIVVTGGGLGAKSINDAMASIHSSIMAQGWNVYHITGKSHYEAVRREIDESMSYTLAPFVYKDMHVILGAADVVVARGSATFIQELAGLGKAAILIPARHLGDQLKNAVMYEKAGAAVTLRDDEVQANPSVLFNHLSTLLNDKKRRAELAAALHSFARPDAARDVAQMIERVFKEERVA
jgi:UDP-N-acetylglucosamine--N-acetylmuramyl-(pentapeptide) pyrophosphoryl-undecaprenol N-acetylglucosamine transferase